VTDYLVQLTRTSESYPTKNVDVEFYANSDRDSVTNEGNPLTVMSTVIDIVKDYLQNNPEVGSFSFVPSKAEYDDTRRLKLYLRYIKGHMNNPRIVKDDLGAGYVSIKVILNRPVDESLDSYTKRKGKFRVGQSVRVGDSIGRITSVGIDSYQVLIGSDQRKCGESELSPLTAKKQKDKVISRKKVPKEKKIIT
jgi:hypothetical protein